MTEEEQIRILEQYENETKQRKQKDTLQESVSKNAIGEKLQSETEANQQSTVDLKDKSESVIKMDSGIKNNSEIKISKADSVASLDTTSTSSSDSDWEKISALEK